MSRLDIEKEAISSLVNADRLHVMYEAGVKPEYFIDPINASAMKWGIEYYSLSGYREAPTEAAIKSEFPTIEIVKPEESIVWVCNELKDRYLSSNIKTLLLNVSEFVDEDPKRAMSEIQSKMWLYSSNTEDRISSSNIKDSIESRKKRFFDRKEASQRNEILGAKLGFEEIDKHTGGLYDGELAAIAGFAKAGKTWIGLNAAKAASLDGKRSLFITLELSIEEIEDRLDAMLSGVSYSRHQQGLLSKKEISDLNTMYEKIDSYGDIIVEQPPVGKRSPQHVVKRARDLNVDVLIIDQMSFMETSEGKPVIELRGYRSIVSELKREISRRDERRIPCFLLAQMNRESIGTRHGRGDMSTLAGTSELERTSDIVYGISKTTQEAINNAATLEILGARRLDRKAWVIKTQLRENTEFSVIRERIEDDE